MGEGRDNEPTSSSASAVRVPTTSKCSMLVAACRLFNDELREGRAVIDDAELFLDAGAVCSCEFV